MNNKTREYNTGYNIKVISDSPIKYKNMSALSVYNSIASIVNCNEGEERNKHVYTEQDDTLQIGRAHV